jgi:hypothetical protein
MPGLTAAVIPITRYSTEPVFRPLFEAGGHVSVLMVVLGALAGAAIYGLYRLGAAADKDELPLACFRSPTRAHAMSGPIAAPGMTQVYPVVVGRLHRVPGRLTSDLRVPR